MGAQVEVTLRDEITSKAACVEQNGGLCVNIQDQTSPALDSYLAQSVSTFTLAAEAAASGLATFNYDFTATTGHGIIIGKEILLLDVVGDRSFYATVLNVVGDVITVDRPIDHTFPVTTLGRIVTTNMAVDGSTDPKIFSLRAGVNEVDTTRFIITMLSGSSMDDGKFGSLATLDRGLVLRIYNGFQKTIFCFKNNSEISQFSYDLTYSDKAAAGTYGLRSRITFGGQSKHGVVLRIGQGDVIQWVVQDDLSGLQSLRIAAMGHQVTE